MKVPRFRNMYQKVGMFGTVQTPFGIRLSDLFDFASRVDLPNSTS